MRTMHSASGNGGGRRRRRPYASKKIARRDFLKLGGAGLAGAALLGVAGRGGGGDAAENEVVFSFFPDPTGSIQKLMDRFNEENADGIRVKLREMPADSGQHFDHILPDHLLRVVPQDPLDGGALVADGAVGVQNGDDVRGVLDQRAQALLSSSSWTSRRSVMSSIRKTTSSTRPTSSFTG